MSKIQNFPDIADSQGYWEGPGLEEKEPVALCAHPWGSEIGLPGSKPETAVAPVHPRMIPVEEAGRRSNSPATGEQGLRGGERGAPTAALQSCIFAMRRSLRTSLFLATI